MLTVRLLTILFLISPALTAAEIIRIPIAQQGSDIDHIERPHRGDSKDSVLQRFGEPLQRSPARGEPPISSWRYAEFSVYFEYDHVIHSVLKHRPKHLPQERQTTD